MEREKSSSSEAERGRREEREGTGRAPRLTWLKVPRRETRGGAAAGGLLLAAAGGADEPARSKDGEQNTRAGASSGPSCSSETNLSGRAGDEVEEGERSSWDSLGSARRAGEAPCMAGSADEVQRRQM